MTVTSEIGVVMLGGKGRSREMLGWIGRGWFGREGSGVRDRAAADSGSNRKQ